MDKEYQGWTNRETWAVKLHWDNNEGDYNFFIEEAKQFKRKGKSADEFAEFLKESAEEIQEMVMKGEGTQEGKLFIQDVGSLWRVNWVEIAEAYYEDIKEVK